MRDGIYFENNKKSKPWRFRWTEDGKRRARYFETESNAYNFRADILKERDSHKALAISSDDRFEFIQIKKMCAAAGVKPLDAVIKGLSIDQDNRDISTYDAAFDLFMMDCVQRNLRPKSISAYESVLNRFGRIHGQDSVDEISKDQILSYVLQSFSNETTRKDNRNRLKIFFNWCAHPERGWCDELGKDDLTWRESKTDKGRIGIFTADQAEDYINAMRDDLKSSVALAMFSGIRSFEILRMSWASNDHGRFYGVDFKNAKIHLAGAWTKSRSYRMLYDLPDNLWRWLKAYGLKSGPVIPINYTNYLKACRKARKTAKIDYWPHNVLRHSFGSYAYHRGLEWTVDIMGHVAGLRTFQRHYKGAASREDSERYFSIKP